MTCRTRGVPRKDRYKADDIGNTTDRSCKFLCV